MLEIMALLPFSLGMVACRMESGRELPRKFDMSRVLMARLSHSAQLVVVASTRSVASHVVQEILQEHCRAPLQ